MRRTYVFVVIGLVAAVMAFILWHRTPSAALKAKPRAAARPVVAPPAVNARIAALARQIPADAISPIAQNLDAPDGTVQRDLEILNEVFVAWQTNFPRTGNPVGENDEITAALAGDNPLHFAFVPPTSPAINAAGQLVDRWGTPFRFHQVSGTVMEIRSAGPDRHFGTADDAQFAPMDRSP